MSAQLRPEGASPARVAYANSHRNSSDPGEVAFDRWLRHELGRLYDATLSEPVPEQLRRLLEQVPERGASRVR
jgi:hypothetical protein